MATTSVLSASRVMASGTIVSRITGLLRATLLVTAIGTTVHADIFNVANTIPNSLYILVAGGVFNAVLVPQLVRAITNDADGGDAYANRIVTLGALVLAGVTAVLVIAAPLLLRLVSSDYFTDPGLAAERSSLIAFARYCLPQVFFYGMFVLFGQILNARGSFGPMMWAPIANNLISIAVLAGYLLTYGHHASGAYSGSQELVLGLGSTIGIAAQALLLVPYLYRSGFRITPRTDFRGTGLGHTLALAKWTVAFVVVNQIAFYVMLSRASGATADDADAAGYTVYSSAFLLTQVPHSIVTVSVATATVPLVSRLAADGRTRDMAAELSRSLRLVLAIIVPFAVALAVLGPVLATIMFSWGAAEGHTTGLGTTMVAFAPGLLLFSVHYMMLRGFYAIEDTKTVFFIQCAVAAVNIACAISFTAIASPRYAAQMLALAYGSSYLVGSALSAKVLAGRLHGLEGPETTRFAVRVAVAALPAAALTWAVVEGLEHVGLTVSSKVDSLVLLACGGAVGLAVYLVLARILHLGEILRIVSMLLPGRGGRSSSHGTARPAPTMGPAQRAGDTSGKRREAGRRDVSTHSVEPGTVLAERYAIEDMLGEDGECTTWRARDRVLARSVVLQIIPSSSPTATEMLAAAKNASRVADSRILQVLDAVDDGSLSYVVREWATGQSLEVVLSEGPMSARRATFLIREIAGAISTAHRSGLPHRRLAPDTIVLTKSSGVKILGLGTLAAARPDADEQADAELADTRDLGRLLYACLTARWPGGANGPLPAAPTEHGKLLRPRQVRAGVPRPLDVLCDRILGNPPRGGEPIRTVDEVKNALNAILANDGFTESSSLRMSGQEANEPLETAGPPPGVLSPDDGGPSTGDQPASTPLPMRVTTEPSTIGRTLWWVVVLVLAAGVLLAVLLIVLKLGGDHGKAPLYTNHPQQSNSQSPPTNTATPPGNPQPIAVKGVASFDPPPGSGDENPQEAAYAIDGNPATTWNTLTYYGGPTFGGIKPGVGLVLDLGSTQSVSTVKVTLVGTPTSLQVRAAPATASTAPTGSATDYTLVGSARNAGTSATIQLSSPVRTRFLLVWLTSLPAVNGGYEGKVAEIQVLG